MLSVAQCKLFGPDDVKLLLARQKSMCLCLCCPVKTLQGFLSCLPNETLKLRVETVLYSLFFWSITSNMPVHSYPLKDICLNRTQSIRNGGPCARMDSPNNKLWGHYGYGKQEWYITNLLVYDSF